MNSVGIRVWGVALLSVLVGFLPPWVLAASESRTVSIRTSHDVRHLNVEIAATEDQRAQGLMQRTSLVDNSGMLFVYDGIAQAGSRGYWMFRTLIPLDIAFIGPNGSIVSTFTMPPCRSNDPALCPVYRPEKPYVGALEMQAGYFAQHHIQVGDMIEQGKELLEGASK